GVRETAAAAGPRPGDDGCEPGHISVLYSGRLSAHDGAPRGAECQGVVEVDVAAGSRAGDDGLHPGVWVTARRRAHDPGLAQPDGIRLRHRLDDLGPSPAPADHPETRIGIGPPCGDVSRPA